MIGSTTMLSGDDDISSSGCVCTPHFQQLPHSQFESTPLSHIRTQRFNGETRTLRVELSTFYLILIRCNRVRSAYCWHINKYILYNGLAFSCPSWLKAFRFEFSSACHNIARSPCRYVFLFWQCCYPDCSDTSRPVLTTSRYSSLASAGVR